MPENAYGRSLRAFINLLYSLQLFKNPCIIERCIFPLFYRLLRCVVQHESYPIDATSIRSAASQQIAYGGWGLSSLITECIRLFTFTSAWTCNQNGRECSSKLGKHVARTRGAGENGSLLQWWNKVLSFSNPFHEFWNVVNHKLAIF